MSIQGSLLSYFSIAANSTRHIGDILHCYDTKLNWEDKENAVLYLINVKIDTSLVGRCNLFFFLKLG